MRNLIVCADGTWNTPDDKDGGLPAPTKVVKFHNAVADAKSGVPDQLKYYHPGVGTEGSKADRLLGGGIGKGLSQNIMSAYKWLATTYKPGDSIYLIGFSRGAFTVRSLGGMLSCCGLLDLSDQALKESDVWDRVKAAFACYRDPQHTRRRLAEFKFHNADSAEKAPKSTKIRFVGVWDTVGALGVPDDLALLNLIDDPREYEFHDTALSDMVATARHAVALDERRQSFAPTLWSGEHADMKQVWFPGVHSDVGGGYLQTGLSDGALLWMMEEAKTAKLKFRAEPKTFVKPDPKDFVHDSCTGVFMALRTEPRAAPNLKAGGRALHKSAVDRHENPPLYEGSFWPTNPLEGGKPVTVSIFARNHWNATELYLEKGVAYTFSAKGEWIDREIPCGPDGMSDGQFHPGELIHAASSLLGKAESAFNWLVDNPKADFLGTKRVEHEDWFALIGMVANNAIKAGRQGLPQNEIFLIGSNATFTPKAGGYLHCFANDAWHAYENNRGSVSLTVSRV